MDTKVLIVDDDKGIRRGLCMILGDSYCVLKANQGSKALKIIDQEQPDIVLLDIGIQEMDGIQVLRRIKKKNPDIAVIMITAVKDAKTIVKALKLGAYDYLVKPIDSQELLLTIANATENKALKNQIRSIQQPRVNKYRFEFIGRDSKIKAVVDIARKVAKSPDTPFLITGESGSGKGVLAKATHYNSQKNPGPFVTVNCGAIAKDLVESELFGYEKGAFTGARQDGSRGRFEEADGGTLFLDEIGAMPLPAQVKLLAVLEERFFYRIGGSRPVKVTARIIAATNTDLEKAVETDKFRKDLFFRLNVVRIDLPSLRQRPDDILLLTKHFMDQYNQKFGKNFKNICPEAKTFLLDYHWPGNVRELRNTIERIVLMENEDTLRIHHLYFLRTQNGKKMENTATETACRLMDYNEVTKNLITEAMEITTGNVTEAARLMNIPPHKLRYRIKKYRLPCHPN